MSFVFLVLCILSVVSSEKTSDDKKRGLFSEAYYGGVQPQPLLIRTHFADGLNSGNPTIDKRFELAIVPVGSVPSQLPVVPKEYVFVTRRIRLPVDYQYYQPYNQLPYPAQVPYSTPYAYQTNYPLRQPLASFGSKQLGYVIDSNDGLDYPRPHIDERSVVLRTTPIVRKSVPVEIETPDQLYPPRQAYLQEEGNGYAPVKPIYSAIRPDLNYNVPDQQESSEKPIVFPSDSKN